MMTALAEYGGTAFDREVARLAALAGAGGMPQSQFAPGAAISGQSAANMLLISALNSLGYGIREREMASQGGGLYG
jgi:hypothetical protein